MLTFHITDLLHPDQLIAGFGTAATIGVILIVFAETGLLLGFFLPGDSLLFLAGVYTTTSAKSGNHPHLTLGLLLPGVIIAAIVGGQTGYLIGRTAGVRLFHRPDSRLFKEVYVERTREVLERYGETKAVLLSRFIPVVRTFMNPAVGVAEMPQRAFTIANVVGGVVWAGGIVLLGYGLGKSVSIDKYILPITLVIVVVSAIPVINEFRGARRRGRA